MDSQTKNNIVELINKELCDRNSVIRIRKQSNDNDVYVIELVHDPFIVDEVALPLNPQLTTFISSIYAAEGLEISFNNSLSRYWIVNKLSITGM